MPDVVVAPTTRLSATLLATALMVGYLIASAAILAVGGHAGLVAMHLAIAAVAVFAARRDQLATTDVLNGSVDVVARLVTDILPAVVTTAIAYGEVPLVVEILGSPYRDGLVQAWELRIFGSQISQTLSRRLPYLPLSEVLHAGYLAFYLAIYLPPLLLYLRGERRGSGEAMLAFTATWLPVCLLSWVFPVQGPRFVWGSPPYIPDGPIRRFSLMLLAAGSARGTAFPSLHMAGSVALALVAWRWQRRAIRWGVIAVAVLIAIGAVYAGFHYAVDIIVGAAVGLAGGGFAIWWANPRSMLVASRSRTPMVDEPVSTGL